MLFETFNLDSRIANSIKQAGFPQASKIQQLSIPEIIAGKDVLAASHSGTGKSAAFIIPLIQKLLIEHPKSLQEQPLTEQNSFSSISNMNPLDTESNAFNAPESSIDEDSSLENMTPQTERGPRILILTPTREMANQVSACIRRFSNDCQLRYGILVGGAPYPPQVRMLKKPIDFLVATPGRLMDHVKNERVNFSRVQCLVIDEVSRMLDMGMVNDIKEIRQHITQPIQTLFFSSSLEGEMINELSQRLQNNPVRIELARGKQSYRQLKQSMYITDEGEHKFKVCQALIGTDVENDGENKVFENILIFSQHLERLQQLAGFLISARFHAEHNNANVLISAKGQKIYLVTDNEPHNYTANNTQSIRLIHLDLPEDNQRILQRLDMILDTAGHSEVNLLVGQNDWPVLHQLERFIGKTIVRKKIAGIEPESSEPTVGTHKSSVEKIAHKTKNRNPYSGRRNNKNSTHKKPEQKSSSPQTQKQPTTNPDGTQKNSSRPKTNSLKNTKPKGRNQNQPKSKTKPAGAQYGNTFQADNYQDERELSWKQYISNISSGNVSKSANKKYRKHQGNSTGFDLNHSPMAINTKKIRDMQPEEQWTDESRSNKPSVQIRLKSQSKSREQSGNKQEDSKNLDNSDSDRIGGKLGITK